MPRADSSIPVSSSERFITHLAPTVEQELLSIPISSKRLCQHSVVVVLCHHQEDLSPSEMPQFISKFS